MTRCLYLILIIASLLSVTTVQITAQTLQGRYEAGDEFIEISGDKIKFEVLCDCAISMMVRGEGIFEQIGNYLLVSTGNYSGLNSTVQSNCKGKSEFRVQDLKGVPAANAIVRFNIANDLYQWFSTDSLGKLIVPDEVKGCSARVESLGYSPVNLFYSPGCEYQVNLADGIIIENRRVAFRIVSYSGQAIQLVMLQKEPKQENPTLKQLQKLERKTPTFRQGTPRMFQLK